MPTTYDASVGLAAEGTPGTYQAPTRWYEFTEESLSVEKNVVQGAGMRVGSRVNRSPRRVVTAADAGGDVTVECVTRGMGLLWESCLGAGTSTLVSGSTYQQLFTLSGNPNLPSRTLQKGTPQVDGTVSALSLTGAAVTGWEFSIDNRGLAMLQTSWNARDFSTAQSYVAPSYVAAPNLFHFAQGAVTIGGTVTAPTTTALASGGTAVANVRDFTLSGANNLNVERYNFGGAGRKNRHTVGLAELSGEMTIEYDGNTIRDAYLADTELAVTLTLTSTESLSTGTATLQIVLPAIKLNGAVPAANGGDLVTLSVPFDVLDNLTAAQPIFIVHRTADTSL